MNIWIFHKKSHENAWGQKKMLSKNWFQPIVTCMVNLSYRMSKKQVGTSYYIKTNYALSLMINIWPPILVSSWVVGAYLHLLFILYGTNPKWGEKVHCIFIYIIRLRLKKAVQPICLQINAALLRKMLIRGKEA